MTLPTDVVRRYDCGLCEAVGCMGAGPGRCAELAMDERLQHRPPSLEIVGELRKWATIYRGTYGAQVCTQAAEEIERLREALQWIANFADPDFGGRVLHQDYGNECGTDKCEICHIEGTAKAALKHPSRPKEER